MIRFACFLALALLLAGCATPEPGSPAAAPSPAPAADAPAVYRLDGNTTLGASSVQAPDRPTLRFDTSNATAIVVELAWNDTVQDLNPYLEANVDHCTFPSSGPFTKLIDTLSCTTDDALFQSPGFGAWRDAGGQVGAPNSPSRFSVDGQDLHDVQEVCHHDCHWQAWAESRAAYARLDWTLAVSVFHGDVPPGYTALPR